jgi:hypothetical protein
MTDESYYSDRLLAGSDLRPEHIQVLGPDLAPDFTRCLQEHRRGCEIGVSRLFDLLRLVLLRSFWRTVEHRSRYDDHLWLQYQVLKLILRMCAYQSGPSLRILPRTPPDDPGGRAA